MNKFLYIIFTVLFSAAVVSCENDLDLNIENTDGVLTMNGYLYTGQDTNVVFLSLTSMQEPLPVSTAKLEMRINGELVETLNSAYIQPETTKTEYFENGYSTYTYPEEMKQGVYMLTKKFNAGDKVRIDAYFNGQHAWAEDIAPKQVKDMSADFRNATHTFKEDGYSDNYTTEEYTDVDISFSDISSSNDYYRLTTDVYKSRKDKSWHTIESYWNYDEEKEEEHIKYGVEYYNRFDTYLEAYAFVKENYDDIIETDTSIFFLTERVYNNRYYENSYQNIEYRYDNDVILSEDETQKTDSDLDILIASINNQYRVFSDNQFNNSNTVLHISVPYDMDAINEKSEIWVDWAIRNAPEELLKKAGDYYTYKIRLELQSISEQQYFYLRALNAINSDFYEDNSDLTGAMKIPSNVSGGCGNISITTRSFYEIKILEDYHPKNIVIKQSGNWWD